MLRIARACSVLTASGLLTAACTAAVPTPKPPPEPVVTGIPTVDLSSFGRLPPVPPPDTAVVSCRYSTGGGAVRSAALPSSDDISTSGTVRITLDTNRGRIGLALRRAESPCAVNSFVGLAAQHYFDNTNCHRLSTSTLRLLQCGDPSGTGRGGPGYTFPNEYPTTTYAADNPAVDLPVIYPRGTVAMANNGMPGTNGSQFFLVYGDSPIPPLFTVFGVVDAAGLAVLDTVAAGGQDGSLAAAGGHPRLGVHIEHAGIQR